MIGTAEDMSIWRTERPRYRADIFLTQEMLAFSDSFDGNSAGFELRATMLDAAMPVPAGSVSGAQAVIVEVRCDQSSSIERLQRLLAESPATPVLAVARDPSLADVRMLMRTGVADILPLPLRMVELEPALERISLDLDRGRQESGQRGQIVTAIKSRGGVGATSLLTQLGCLGSVDGGETCLIDFDIQFGNAALYLGQLPALGLKDLLAAKDRLDSALIRSAVVRHASGLSYLAAPQEILPLDTLTPERVEPILDLAAREFQTVFVDLPQDWTDWSLSILARSSLILLVSELSIASLHQAKRQLDFLRDQDLGSVPVNVVMNKVAKGLFRTVDFRDAARILGRDVAFSIADDAETVRAALDRGETVAQINARSKAARNLRDMAKALQVKPAVAK